MKRKTYADFEKEVDNPIFRRLARERPHLSKEVIAAAKCYCAVLNIVEHIWRGGGRVGGRVHIPGFPTEARPYLNPLNPEARELVEAYHEAATPRDTTLH